MGGCTGERPRRRRTSAQADSAAVVLVSADEVAPDRAGPDRVAPHRVVPDGVAPDGVASVAAGSWLGAPAHAWPASGEPAFGGLALAGLLVAGLALAGVAVAGGIRPSAAVGLAYIAAVTVPLWRTDVRERRLPDRLVLPGFVFAAVGCAWDALASGSPWWAPPAGMLVVGGFFAALEVGGGVGMGDVKLAALLALCLVPVVPDAPAVRVAGFVACAFVAAGVAAAAAWAHPAAAPVRSLPFGPYLLVSFWLSVLCR